MNKKQKANVIGAGTVTGLLLMLGLAFGGVGAKDNTAVTEPVSTLTINQDGSDPTVEQLQETLQVMQNREAEYAAQIEQANQLLAEQANQQASYSEDDDDDDRYENGEYKSNEGGEYEGGEGGEYEDDD